MKITVHSLVDGCLVVNTYNDVESVSIDEDRIVTVRRQGGKVTCLAGYSDNTGRAIGHQVTLDVRS